ncbi:helix-turn-helix domain-containing protein [Paraferrimonas sp. SM1919]|uniref:helix-turn-helix domain-containing protein n=1 Tax=Paraferrimonas sp. SM1919 TaxID=2662263 RepID=UPI0013D64CBA|nr:AraC family transcriptional regulator [Paraferrimonas sp. SM1919]
MIDLPLIMLIVFGFLYTSLAVLVFYPVLPWFIRSSPQLLSPPVKPSENEVAKLTQAMSSQCYLDPDLNLHDFAKLTKLGERRVSEIIRLHFKTNYCDYVAAYRVNHAKSLMSNRKNLSLSLLNIALLSGFNSKSSFNLQFKKQVGLTPSQYRHGQH